MLKFAPLVLVMLVAAPCEAHARQSAACTVAIEIETSAWGSWLERTQLLWSLGYFGPVPVQEITMNELIFDQAHPRFVGRYNQFEFFATTRQFNRWQNSLISGDRRRAREIVRRVLN